MRKKQIEHFKSKREIDLEKKGIVYVRCYKNPSKPTWQRAVVKEKLGQRNYLCNPEEENVEWKRRIDQLKRSGTFYDKEFLEPSTENRVLLESRTDHSVQEGYAEKTQEAGETLSELIPNPESGGENKQESKESLCDESQVQTGVPSIKIDQNITKSDIVISASKKDVKREES